MAKKKTPAYQRYPSDYLSDENVVAMTLEQEGAYNRLMDHCWLEGSIPSDLRRLSALCKNVSEKRMQAIWPALAPCFRSHPDQPGRLVHPRLDKERQKQAEFSTKMKESGKLGAAIRYGERDRVGDSHPIASTNDDPIASESSSSSSPFSKQITDAFSTGPRGKSELTHISDVIPLVVRGVR